MPSIAVLADAVVDQIAAGEVVERPASVVKELLENALDADARAVEIAVEDGGRGRIRVSDDGVGMRREDAVLALGRHATSKIRTANDLVGVGSFGFRGEALPAIASVCELELQTASDDGEGTALRASAGVIRDVRDAARRRGTTVTVSRLFFNAPARQRFLRSARSEWRAIADLVTSIALVRRGVRIAVAHDDRQTLSLPPAPTLRARVAALWTPTYAERLVDVDDVSGAVHVSGLVERPADVGTASRRVHLTVNGRPIRDGGLVRAAEAAYRSTIPAGTRPSLLLELTIPADLVDVNVHPTKAEVRFRDRWILERAVEKAVRRSLGLPAAAATLGRPAWLSSYIPVPAAEPGVQLLQATPGADGPLLAPSPAHEPGLIESNRDSSPTPNLPAAAPPLEQLRRTYLMFERDDGIVLIDQHSAHERVLYERFMRDFERGTAPAQRLLFPLTLHLTPAEGEAYEEHRELFERLGFEVEAFGGHTLIVHSVPAPHARFDAERCLRETLAALTGNRVASTAARHERLAATVACKGAVKAGDALSDAEMRALFLALAATTLPAHDVHGRSTIVHLPWDEIERRFGRR
ncbi:MAG: DNA mismatch repair endonuclease MutL [Gemmatimonadaceae bacterium]